MRRIVTSVTLALPSGAGWTMTRGRVSSKVLADPFAQTLITRNRFAPRLETWEVNNGTN